MIKNSTSLSIIGAVIFASYLISTGSATGQTIEIETDGHSGHGVLTSAGTITAKHVGGINFNFFSDEMDIVIDTNSASPTALATSDQPPAYFLDRRGKRHEVKATGKLNFQTIVSMRFFAGESGMPVFASDGSVTCVVIGNVFIDGRWLGRVSRVTPIINFAKRAVERFKLN